jgi:hypothetical protein
MLSNLSNSARVSVSGGSCSFVGFYHRSSVSCIEICLLVSQPVPPKYEFATYLNDGRFNDLPIMYRATGKRAMSIFAGRQRTWGRLRTENTKLNKDILGEECSFVPSQFYLQRWWTTIGVSFLFRTQVCLSRRRCHSLRTHSLHLA